jgi:ATP-dependent Clp endopeptidase proteolytic subunit ClpP
MGEPVKTARSLATLRQGKTDWFRFENNATANTATVYIYDEIGYWGVTAADFVDALQGVANADLTVHINSPGGDVFDGIAILNALRAHQGAITTVVDGIAASAASFIAQAGQTRVMARNSEMMIHDASGLCIGNAADMRTMLDLLDRASDNIASVYAERSGVGDIASWRDAMGKETWYSAEEAVAAGLADSVDGATPEEKTGFGPNDSWDLGIYAHARRADAPDPEIFTAPPQGPPSPMFDLTAFKRGLGHGA